MDRCLARSFVAGARFFTTAIWDFTLHTGSSLSASSVTLDECVALMVCFFHGHGSVEGDELPHTYYMEGDGVRFSDALADIAFSLWRDGFSHTCV